MESSNEILKHGICKDWRNQHDDFLENIWEQNLHCLQHQSFSYNTFFLWETPPSIVSFPEEASRRKILA